LGNLTDNKHKRLLQELEALYSPKRSGSSQESEKAKILNGYLDEWLNKLQGSLGRETMVRYILEEDSGNLGIDPRELKQLRKYFGGTLPQQIKSKAEMLCHAFEKIFEISLERVILPDERLKEMLESPSPRAQESRGSQANENGPSSERLGTFANLICMICGAIRCQTHGHYLKEQEEIIYSDESDEENSSNEPLVKNIYLHQPLGMRYNDLLRKQDARNYQQLDQPEFLDTTKKPCSSDCYLRDGHHDTEFEWSADDKATVRSMLVSIPSYTQRPCCISFFLNLPCWQVDCEIKRAGPRDIPEQPVVGRTKKPDWYDNKRKVLKSDWMDQTSAHLHQERYQANPVRLKPS
jgi:hypothetical protein